MVDMAKGTAKGVKAKSRTDLAELSVDLQHLDRDGKDRLLGRGTYESTPDKRFIGI